LATTNAPNRSGRAGRTASNFYELPGNLGISALVDYAKLRRQARRVGLPVPGIFDPAARARVRETARSSPLLAPVVVIAVVVGYGATQAMPLAPAVMVYVLVVLVAGFLLKRFG
jgi:hypothetical protein